jgi:accessory colonization factor AcfC
MFINVKSVKAFVKDHDKQLSTTAIEALNFKVQAILLSAINNCRGFKRITNVEIEHTK